MITGLIAGAVTLALTGCGGDGATTPVTRSVPSTGVPTTAPGSVGLADVIAVSASGTPGDYSLSVTVASPDLGCGSYADWWEVVSGDGELIYRRVLLHSHAGEQPFTRSGGPVNIKPNEVVTVRAHMSDAGYGGSTLRGTAADGFSTEEITPAIAPGLETQEPLPGDCAF